VEVVVVAVPPERVGVVVVTVVLVGVVTTVSLVAPGSEDPARVGVVTVVLEPRVGVTGTTTGAGEAKFNTAFESTVRSTGGRKRHR